MNKLLHISASPRGGRSESLALGEAFLSAFQATRPEVPVETWDLWDGTLPSFGPAAAHAKMAVFAGADPQGRRGRGVAGGPGRRSSGSTRPTGTSSPSPCGTPASRTS